MRPKQVIFAPRREGVFLALLTPGWLAEVEAFRFPVGAAQPISERWVEISTKLQHHVENL